MTNVSKAMEYATTFEREAMRKKLDAALGDLNHMNLIQLEAMVLHHAQQIKDIAKHLLELKRLVTPMMEFKRREWVGLTDEDIKDIVGRNDSGGIGAYTREMFKQIEDKLREKNT